MGNKRVNVSICDTDEKNCNYIADTIKRCISGVQAEIWIDRFYTGRAFLKALETESYDITFIAMKLEDMNGLQLGKRIRNHFNNHSVQIIYMSVSGFCTMEHLETQPLNMLKKPIAQNIICMTFLKAMEKLENEELFFSYTKNHMIRWEAIRSIVCFESFDRQLMMYTFNRQIEFYGKLKDVYERLKDYGFIYAHQSYLVNRRYIKAYDGRKLLLENGMEVEVSHKRRKEVAFSLQQFML